MTIRHLRIFTAVAEAGSMSAAARALFVSQPSVSQAIGELEKEYGVKLFERLSQKLYLTGEGELLLSYSRHILDSVSQLEQAMGQAAKGPTLRIGCSVTVGTCLIGGLLDILEQRMPELETRVVVANSAQIEQAILNNQVDLGIVEGILKSPELQITPVCKDELAVVCGSGHPLAREKTVTVQMLSGQSYLSREDGSAGRNQLEQLLEEQGVQLRRSFCSTNTEAIKNALIRGRGIAILSRRMVEQELASGQVVALDIEGVSVTRDIRMAIHRNKYVSEGIRMLRQIAQETL